MGIQVNGERAERQGRIMWRLGCHAVKRGCVRKKSVFRSLIALDSHPGLAHSAAMARARHTFSTKDPLLSL